ncbi:potassium/proton antiporter [uncultured Clostridium sp.]|uniref:potassium/proton antiporter n=1 Tax=uncultured Clostridium sp. TaxID=59620 RepID=UPI0025D536B0|nr:potassium/proton antiporter [uncultured Clostridium sp.]
MILLCACVLLSCVIANRFSNKLGMPALLLFMALGMLFGSDGIFKISFDNYHVAKEICNIALIFIMFYGGFGTKWKVAKPVAVKSVLLSTIGVLITAFLTSAFCHYILKFTLLDSFLIGAVISSTDAASVFSILRSKHLSLKYGTASMLELESGSNDPIAFMMMMIIISFIKGTSSVSGTIYMLFSQIVFGVLIGVGVAVAGIFALRRLKIVTDGLETIFMTALVLVSYALSESIEGNGYLSVYLTGIILGNSKINNKIILVHFFDGITALAQILIFFLLGLLSFPHEMPASIIPAVSIAVFLTFIARPIAVSSILLPFKASIKQCMLVSWSGLRGAASIVFAIMAIASDIDIECDLYHIVFLISLLSVAFQGSLLPAMAKKLDMIDEKNDVRKTFNDYQEDSEITLMKVFVPEGHSWANKTIESAGIPSDSLALIIKRNGTNIVPKGDTMIKPNDSIILSIPKYNFKDEINLREVKIDKENSWCDKAIENIHLPDDILITLIKREGESIIPRGNTVIMEGDTVVLYN